MSCSVGETFGPYEIIAPIGRGGMGEVWKARDTRLDRIVAIKTSKAEFSDRFTREARAVAALNHPHICQLYDVGPDYLVMEYVEGSPLKMPLRTEKAVEYADQILSALDASHRKGIIHRDLKPANILVTKHGIKLLDFGLARIASLSADSTLTQTGEQMGTPAYMAPEQWEGKSGDARTDIYCFGCVLYEILTGKRAVQGERVAVPSPLLDSIIRTCLEQAPEDRWQTASDLRRAMNLPEAPAPKRSSTWKPMTVVALVTLAAGWFLSLRLGRAPAASEVISFAVYPPEKTAFFAPNGITLNVPQFALAPDGRTLVFTAGAAGERPLLWRRPLDETSAQPLPGTEDAQDPFWSPDSRSIAFFAEGKLKRISAAGGTVQVIAPSIWDARGGTWSRENTILFANGVEPIQRVNASGGPPSPIKALAEDESAPRYPVFLPGDHGFLYLSLAFHRPTSLYAVSLKDMRSDAVVAIDNSAVYSKPGYLLFAQSNTLFAQPFDLARLKVTDQPITIAEHVGHTSTFKSAISVSDTGTLAWAGALSPGGRLTWFGRSGRSLNSLGPEAYYTDFRLSPDEKVLAASMMDARTGTIDVWIDDLARGTSNRVTGVNALLKATPIWSPDGSQLVFRVSRGVVELYRRSAAGGGAEEVVLPSSVVRSSGIRSNLIINTDWSPDGKNILFSVPDPETGMDLWMLPLLGDRRPVKFLASPATEMHGNFSPDGHLVAYTSNESESGKFQVYVQTIPLSDKKWQVSTSGGYEPRWRADGREIYYLSEDRKLMAVDVGPGPSFGIPRILFQTQVQAGVAANRMHYVPSRDGRRFLINTQSATSVTPITVVTNWTKILKK
jgi:Tol biopolymer transport system component/predicted Ser/Thr protein kinase